MVEREKIVFIPLGGGQNVGASCYFLKLGDSNILLDCGIGFNDELIFAPNFYTLLTSNYIQSLKQISQIFISHAHLDHVGYLINYLPDFLSNFGQSAIYMTDTTFILLEYQMNFKQSKITKQMHQFQNFITKVSYLQHIPFANTEVTFFRAGHIPGAMMTLFNYKNKKILYTGDYSIKDTPLTSACQFPDDDIDILIMCGLHAKHANYNNLDGYLPFIVNKMRNMLDSGRSGYYCIPQLSKSVEFLEYISRSLPSNVPIYIDDTILNLVRYFEKLYIPLMKKNIYPLSVTPKKFPNIVLGTTHFSPYVGANYDKIDVKFSLHDDFDDIITFVKKINPKLAIVVHSPSSNDLIEETIEQRLMIDANCRTQFIFAENQEIYVL